jgi:hypothetical protein
MDKGDKVSVINSIDIEIGKGYRVGQLIITPEAVGTVISKLLPEQSDVDWMPKIKFVVSKGFELITFVETSNLKIISE